MPEQTDKLCYSSIESHLGSTITTHERDPDRPDYRRSGRVQCGSNPCGVGTVVTPTCPAPCSSSRGLHKGLPFPCSKTIKQLTVFLQRGNPTEAFHRTGYRHQTYPYVVGCLVQLLRSFPILCALSDLTRT